LLEGITATEYGYLKHAAVPIPSAKDALPLPASVVTALEVESTRRMRWLFASATTITKGSMTATEYGWLKLAAAPKPSAKDAMLLPASVETTPLLMPSTTRATASGDESSCALPAAPHSSTDACVLGVAHLTHALALHAMFPPLGSAAGALAPGASRCAPLARMSELPAALKTPAA
jgi:hypothetical protein